jgi:hypothetical protein
MTSAELVDRVQNHRFFRNNAQLFNSGDVYPAATFAQKDICASMLILQDVCRLKLIANQERYQASTATITNITNAAPFQVTATAHGLNTGDSAIIGGVQGATGANGRWTSVTKIDADNFTVDGSTAPGVWTAGGTIYHTLYSALVIKSISKLDSPYGSIIETSKATVDFEKVNVTTAVAPESVVKFYHIFTEPIIIGFEGIPNANINTEVTFNRKPVPTENISSTVNPIIQSQYDEVLFFGTLYRVLYNVEGDAAKAAMNEAMTMYSSIKGQTNDWLNKQRRPKREVAPRMRIV